MESLEKIIKKGKNFLGGALFSAASLYSCGNPANPEISKPKTEITNPENYSPEKPAKKIVTLSLEEPIKTYAFGDDREQRWDTELNDESNSYRYPDQKENVQIDLEGNLTKQEKKNLMDKLVGQYDLVIWTQDTKEKKAQIQKRG